MMSSLLIMKFVIFLLVGFDVSLGAFQGSEDKYIRTFRDKRLSLYTYLKLTNVNELQCTLACSNDEECGSINHQKDENLCELNQLMETEHQREDLTTEKGWNHFIKSKKSQVNPDIYIATGKRNSL